MPPPAVPRPHGKQRGTLAGRGTAPAPRPVPATTAPVTAPRPSGRTND